VSLVAVPATLPLTEIVERLDGMQPPVLMGYPTKLAQLAAMQLSGHLQISPDSVIAISELLTNEDRTVITDAFGVPVVDQFASTEGLAGQSDPGHRVLTFASDMCIAELVDDHNRPVEPGVVASKVLLTNLHNFTQPLIRYELTDRFVAHSPDHGHLRASVEGRADSLFRYGSVVVHPLTIRTVMVKASGVDEYQVRQTPHGIHIDAVTSTGFDHSGVIHDLMQSLRVAGLHEPDVSFRVVDAINRHSRTGKVQRFIPLADDGTSRNSNRRRTVDVKEA
jgi:phenylacetate-coenzyme A ligase PaaK-like adenylate-forming protein